MSESAISPPASPQTGEMQLPIPETHPLLFRFARETGRALSFFDIEATGLNYKQDSFGITEFACVALMPTGQAYKLSTLIDPENPIGEDAGRITGITPEMVRGKPTIGQHAPKILSMMEKSFMWGFNSHSYDIPAILYQLDRYQIARPAQWQSLDVREVWMTAQNTRKGTLQGLAEHYGVSFNGAHRGLADCLGLANVAEQMLWRHGSSIFNDHARLNWDGVAREAEVKPRAAPRSSARGGELGPTQLRVKAAIDEALPRHLSVEQFAHELAAKGIRLEVTKGGAAYIAKGEDGTDERCAGSPMGPGYSWKDVRVQLSGDIPERLYGAGPVYGERAPKSDAPTHAPPAAAARPPAPDAGARLSEEARAKEALLELAKAGGSIDFAKAAQMSGASARTVSFAISSLLADGSVQPAQASIAEAQQWLDAKWSGLPTQDRLTPLLEACKKLGAPESVDFAQLRVAVASRKAQMPRNAQGGSRDGGNSVYRPPNNGASSGAPRQASAPSFDDFSGAHPFDDMPPFGPGADAPDPMNFVFDDSPPNDAPSAARTPR